MGEIKSTLDLVMEKTRNMTLTREEQERRSAEERRELARGMARRYLNKEIDVRKFDMEAAVSEALRKAVAGELIRTLSLDSDPERLFSGLARLLGDQAAEAHKRASDLFQRYVDDFEALAEGLAGAARDELARAGISGPAVLPNTEASEVLREKADELREKYDEDLKGIVKEVLTSIET